MLGGLRVATAADAAQLLAIYAPYVLHTTITFETQVPTEQAFAGRIAGTPVSYTHLEYRGGTPSCHYRRYDYL